MGGTFGRIGQMLSGSLSELNPFRGDEPFVSVDIGSSSIKIVEVRGRDSQMRVSAAASLPTPPSAIQNNIVYEQAAVAECIRALLDSKGISARKVVTAVPGPAVIIKRVTLPAQNAKELENTILFEAGNFIPEDLENVNLDYQVTDYIDDGKRMEVILVAAKKDIVASYVDVLRAANLSPVIVDVDYFAVENMFEANYDSPPGRAIALVNIGARYSSINILKNGRSTFTGDVPVGGRDITEGIMRDLGVGQEEADAIKAGRPAQTVPADQLTGVIEGAAASLIDEIHHALSFFWTAATDETIDHVYLSGGVAKMPGLAEQLGERVGAPATIADPFSHVSLDRDADTPELREHASEFAVALGLATRRPDDK